LGTATVAAHDPAARIERDDPEPGTFERRIEDAAPLDQLAVLAVELGDLGLQLGGARPDAAFELDRAAAQRLVLAPQRLERDRIGFACRGTRGRARRHHPPGSTLHAPVLQEPRTAGRQGCSAGPGNQCAGPAYTNIGPSRTVRRTARPDGLVRNRPRAQPAYGRGACAPRSSALGDRLDVAADRAGEQLARTPDLLVRVGDHLAPLRDPADRARQREDAGEHADRNAERLLDDARIEVDVRIELALNEVIVFARDLLELHRKREGR